MSFGDQYLGAGSTAAEAIADAEAKAATALGVTKLTNVRTYAFAGSLLDENGQELKAIFYTGVVVLTR